LYPGSLLINSRTALAALRAASEPNVWIALSPDSAPAKSDSPRMTITGKPFDKHV
jgi:hypothetical protein